MNKVLKYLIIGIVALTALFFGFMQYTKSHSPQTTESTKNGDLEIKVTYSQPSKKGRVIFGELLPLDKVWRTGANEATLISFNKDITFGDKPVKAGEYSLWSIPKADGFTFILNSETGQWGTQYDETKDVAKAEADWQETKEITEKLSISLIDRDSTNSVLMNLKWDTKQAQVKIK
jgi:hypothetical protein